MSLQLSSLVARPFHRCFWALTCALAVLACESKDAPQESSKPSMDDEQVKQQMAMAEADPCS